CGPRRGARQPNARCRAPADAGRSQPPYVICNRSQSGTGLVVLRFRPGGRRVPRTWEAQLEASSDTRIARLIDRGEEAGCLNLSEVAETVQSLELESDEVESVYEQIHARGIDLSDDCARSSAGDGSYANAELAATTTDAMQLFLNEVSRHGLLSAAEEVALAKRIERGDQEAKERMINSNLRLVVSLAKKYQASQLSLLDLIQELFFKDTAATEKFDWRRGY